MKKNMTRYAFCFSLLFCGCIVLQSPVCTIMAEEPVLQQTQLSNIVVVKEFFTSKAGTISLEALLKALSELCPNVFEKIVAQHMASNAIIAEEVVALIHTNEALLPVDLQSLLNSKQNHELVAGIKEAQAFAELENFVSEQPRWKIQPWPILVDKIVLLLKDNPKSEYKAFIETLSGLKNSGSWGIKFKLLKHLGILPEKIRKSGLAGLNRGLSAAGL